MCPSCARVIRSSGLCDSCRLTLVPAPDRAVAGVPVRAGYLHTGAARRLVHRLKYQGVVRAAGPLAGGVGAVVERAGDRPQALVPVPRAAIRRGIHGIDPAAALASELARMLGVPVVHALRPGWWWPRHAGRGRAREDPRLFASGRILPEGCALVDDVITTGATLGYAIRLLEGVSFAYAATLALPARSKGPSGPSRPPASD